jgi:cation transport ATPase
MITGVRPKRAAAKGVTLQQERRTVAPVKEGRNDAPALAKADVGR